MQIESKWSNHQRLTVVCLALGAFLHLSSAFQTYVMGYSPNSLVGDGVPSLFPCHDQELTPEHEQTGGRTAEAVKK